jgi:hypothetical protein
MRWTHHRRPSSTPIAFGSGRLPWVGVRYSRAPLSWPDGHLGAVRWLPPNARIAPACCPRASAARHDETLLVEATALARMQASCKHGAAPAPSSTSMSPMPRSSHAFDVGIATAATGIGRGCRTNPQVVGAITSDVTNSRLKKGRHPKSGPIQYHRVPLDGVHAHLPDNHGDQPGAPRNTGRVPLLRACGIERNGRGRRCWWARVAYRLSLGVCYEKVDSSLSASEQPGAEDQ